MNRERLFAVLLGVGVIAVAGGIASAVLQTDPADDPVVVTDSPPPETRELDPPEPTPNPAEVVTPVRVESETESIAAPVSSALPLEYTEALAGITGRVVEEDGAPVVGIAVSLLELRIDPLFLTYRDALAGLDEQMSVPEFDVARGVTDEEGRFTLSGAELVSFHALGVDLGGARGTLRILEHSLKSGEAADIGDIVLSPFITFTGQVVDDRGEGIAGARVRAVTLPRPVFDNGVQDIRSSSAVIFSDPPAVFEPPANVKKLIDQLPVPTAYADAEGRFRLEGVPQGLITVVADREGYLAGVIGRPTGRRPETDIGQLGLTRGRSVLLRASDQSGDPVPGVEVMVGAMVPFIGVVLAQRGTPTDVKGLAEVSGLPLAGDLFAAFRKPGEDWNVVGPVEAGAEFPLTFPNRGELLLRLVDAEGEVVPTARFAVRRRSPIEELPLLSMTPFRALTEPFEKVEDGLYRGRLDAGEYSVLAEAPGLLPAIEGIDVRDDGTIEEATLKFPFASLASVTVTASSDGHALERARVSVHEDDDDPPISRGWTDSAGLTQVELPKDDKFIVRVDHPGFAVARQSFSNSDERPAALEFALTPGGSVEGRLLDVGSPPAEAHVIMLEFRGQGRFHPDDEMPRLGVTGLDGSFAFHHLVPGEYRYYVMSRFLAGDPLKYKWNGDFGPQELLDGTIQVAEGEVTRLDLDLGEHVPEPEAPGVIEGQLLVGGRAIEGAFVRAFSRDMKTAQTDAGGRFRLAGLRAGSIYVQVSEEDSLGRGTGTQYYQGMVEVTADVPASLMLDLPAISEVEVTVFAAGAAVQGCPVQLFAANENGGMQSAAAGTTDASGTAHLRIAAEGEAVLRAEHPEFGLASSTLQLGSGVQRERLELDAGVPVEGAVDVSGSKPRNPPARFLVFERLDDDGNAVDHRQIEVSSSWKFKAVGLQAGDYRVSLQLFSEQYESMELTIGLAGDRNLQLVFEKSQ